MDLKNVDWSKISKLYDDLEASGKLKSSGSSDGSKTTWNPETIRYCKDHIDGRFMREALYGVSRCSMICSDDHIAHVVLRMYVRKIVPFPRPFGLTEKVPEVIWRYLKVVAKEEHDRARRDICFEEEAWNRPSFTYVVKVDYYRPKRYKK